ncbi:MAG: hypothetical protein KAT37_01710 [Candidatus Aenigmarchaeota archaeon]|nr:hypothetical protein [Candidatus Aenigmarchaeota archaeon]
MLEAYAEILALVATIFGILMSAAHFPQALKMYRRKSSADISLLTYSLFFLGVCVWLLYGISISNMPLIASNFVAVVGTILVIIVYFKYRKKEVK